MYERGQNVNRLSLIKEMLPAPHPLVWKCNILAKQIKKIMLPSIARDIWIAWATFNYKELNLPEEEGDSQNILDQIVWFN